MDLEGDQIETFMEHVVQKQNESSRFFNQDWQTRPPHFTSSHIIFARNVASR